MKKKTISPDEHRKLLINSELNSIKEKFDKDILPKNPTKFFQVDEKITWGNHNEVYIREICEGGLYYLIECLNVQRTRDKAPENEFHYIEWIDLFQHHSKWKQTNFAKKDECILNMLNSSLDSLIHKVYNAGVDFDVEYQRDHVWELDDKIALIDSIFNNIEIGKFVFVQRDYGYRGKLFEIIDGKQRLTAIKEFIEDRYQYKGFYYSELSGNDKHKINGHSISYGYLVNPTKKDVYETFIKLNTCGKPMDHKHIDKVNELLKNM